MAASKEYLFLSLVAYFVGACIAQDCLHGFPPALLPEGSEDQPHLLGGTYLFPNMTIQCSGRVTAIDFSGYFNPDVRYNSTLRMQVQLYSLTGSQYMLETAINLVLNVDEFSMTEPNLMLDANGRYYVSQPLVVPLTSTLTTPRQVSPEHILGISLPPTESLSLGEVSHGVSIAVLDDSGSPAVTLSNCWNPSQRRSEPCSVISELTRPVIRLNFTAEGSPPPTTPSSTTLPPSQPSSQIGQSAYYAAAATSGLFAVLFLLAVILALVLVCVLVVISRRNSKSVTVVASGQEPRHQQVARSTVIASNAELGYEMMHSAGNVTGYDFPRKAENTAYQTVTVPEQSGGRYETLDYSTGYNPPHAYNYLHRPPPQTHAEYNVPRGVPPPPDYQQLSVQAQYTNMQQSPSQPPPGTVTGTGPGNEYVPQ